MNHVRTLRILILAEIFLALAGVAVGLVDEATLPPPFQEYARAQEEAPWGWREALLLAWVLPALPLGISAWVGLWRGWRCARWLYTLAWGVMLPLPVFLQPEEVSGVSQCVGTAGSLVSGMMLGLLYFSELRHHYRGGYGSDWKDSGYL